MKTIRKIFSVARLHLNFDSFDLPSTWKKFKENISVVFEESLHKVNNAWQLKLIWTISYFCVEEVFLFKIYIQKINRTNEESKNWENTRNFSIEIFIFLVIFLSKFFFHIPFNLHLVFKLRIFIGENCSKT